MKLFPEDFVRFTYYFVNDYRSVSATYRLIETVPSLSRTGVGCGIGIGVDAPDPS